MSGIKQSQSNEGRPLLTQGHLSNLPNFFYPMSFVPSLPSPITSPLGFCRHPLVLYAFAAFCAAVAGVAIPALDMLYGFWTNGITGPNATPDAIRDRSNTTAWITAIIGLVMFLSAWSFVTFFSMASDAMSKALRHAYFSATLAQDTAYFDTHGPGEIASKASKDIDLIRIAYGEKIGYVIWSLSALLAAVISGFSHGPKMAGFLFATIPIAVLLFGAIAWWGGLTEASVERMEASSSSFIEQMMASIRVIHSFGIEAPLVKRLHEVILSPLEKFKLRKATVRAVELSIGYFLFISTYSLAIWWGGRQILESGLTIGDASTIFFNFVNSLFSFTILIPHLAALIESVGTVKQLRHVIERQPTIDVRDTRGLRFAINDSISLIDDRTSDRASDLPASEFTPSFELQDVTFAYPSRPNVASLLNVSIKAEAGRVTALVGASGSGKSTIANLLLREYDPATSFEFSQDSSQLESQSNRLSSDDDCGGFEKEKGGSKGLVAGAGKVIFSNRDVRDYNIRWLRSQVTTVQQHPQLFTASILENVAAGLTGTIWQYRPEEYARSDAPQQIKQRTATIREMVRQALEKAQAWDFVQKLPEGMDTVVSGGTVGLLSGGQRQRIAIARALIRKPKILCLDEATSALDSATEAKIQQVLQKEQDERGMTIIVIAHRLSTIKSADKIVVMERGRVVESGNHDFLMTESNNGTYRGFVQTQNPEDMEDLDESETELADNCSSTRISAAIQDYSTAFAQSSDPANQTQSSPRVLASLPEFPAPRQFSSLPAQGDIRQGLRRLPSKLDSHPAGAVMPDMRTRKLFFSVYVKAQSLWFLLGFIGALCTGSVLVISSWLVGPAIKSWSIFDNDSLLRSESEKWAFWFLILAVCQLLITAANSFFLEGASEKMAARMKLDSINALLRQEVGFFDRPENMSGGLSSAVDSHPASVAAATGVVSNQVIISIANLIGAFILAMVLNWKVSLPMLPPIAFLLFTSWANIYFLSKFDKKLGEPAEEAASFVSESTGSIRTITALGREQETLRTFEARYGRISTKYGYFSFAINGLGFAFSQGILLWLVALLFYWGGGRLANGSISLSDMLSTVEALLIASLAAGKITTFGQDLSRAQSSFKTIASWLFRTPDIASVPTSVSASPDDTSKDIILKGVEMRYPQRPDRPAIQGLDLVIHHGQTVAFCGTSGGGKSSLLALLERFYDPCMGEITYGARNIQSIPIKDWRSRMALVSQDPVLYNGSIRWNISLGATNPEAVTDVELEEVCRQACILDFIRSLPEGFDTDIGMRGGRLSGGQKQRICIARALLRKPEILLLDEATSALDPESEVQVQKALDNASKGRTTITVAHRLSTIRRADLICVVNEGRVVESGTHASLVAQKGKYFDLIQAQL